jgi:hypothetical protein
MKSSGLASTIDFTMKNMDNINLRLGPAPSAFSNGFGQRPRQQKEQCEQKRKYPFHYHAPESLSINYINITIS